MALVDELNRVKFIAEDFATFRSEANDFFQTNYPDDFNNLLNTELGNAMMDQLAFGMQALAFLVNRRASEYFLDTARLNKSIVKLARMLGKPIEPARPASLSAVLTFDDAPYVFPIEIPVGFQFQGSGDIIYEYRGDVPAKLNVGETTLSVTLKEGESRQLSWVSDQSKNQQFSIIGIPEERFIYSDDLSVTVDGNLWSREDILTFEFLDIYEVIFVDDPPKLRFGDGITGNIPPENSNIVLSYRYGRGLQGAIGSNQISGPVDQLVVNGQTIGMTVTNEASVVGSDPEDIRRVKTFASAFFRTQNAAVVKEDYDTIAELQNGVTLADAQIMRGIDDDLTIQAFFNSISGGQELVDNAVSGILATGVSGVNFLGVSGTGSLNVGGQGGLAVDGQSNLGVSGTQFLGCNGGNVTGIGFLGVSGIPGLQVIGQGGLIVSGIPSLGVSGTDFVDCEDNVAIKENADAGNLLIDTSVSGLHDYLSQTMSDTSKANNVQVVILSVDQNNKYISPTSQTLQDAEDTLQKIADAVVTVNTVDGTPNLVEPNIRIEIGINSTAKEEDVLSRTNNALTGTVDPFGLLVRRSAGNSLYLYDLCNAVRDANSAGDIRYVNAEITSPLDRLDEDGNLIITDQEIIQHKIVTIVIKERFLVVTGVLAETS